MNKYIELKYVATRLRSGEKVETEIEDLEEHLGRDRGLEKV